MNSPYVMGLDQVLHNIDREINNIKGRTVKGMVAAMEFLNTEMNTTPPLVPEDTKYMNESWYIFPAIGPGGPIVTAGYTAYYAPYVHEMTGIVNWTRANSGAKWLQIHFERNRLEMQLIIASYAARGL